MNDSNEAKLAKKYHHVCFYDDDNEEIRRVVGIEWHTANRARGIRPQYYQQVVTQSLLDSVSQEGYEAYAINEVLHEMIAQCPVVHNAL
jgi:peroxiredoxin